MGQAQATAHDGCVDAALDDVPPLSGGLGHPTDGRVNASVELLHRNVDAVAASVWHLVKREAQGKKYHKHFDTRTHNDMLSDTFHYALSPPLLVRVFVPSLPNTVSTHGLRNELRWRLCEHITRPCCLVHAITRAAVDSFFHWLFRRVLTAFGMKFVDSLHSTTRHRCLVPFHSTTLSSLLIRLFTA